MRLGKSTYRWLDERLDLESALRPLREKRVPMHRHSIWYYLGGMALTLMLVQVVTGLLLMIYYRATVEAAHPSIVRIMTEVPAGSLIRSLHSWTASALVLVLGAHALSTLLMAAYRRPRELTWLSGVALLGLVMFFAFSGYLLPWNERAYFATRVGTGLAAAIPLVGSWLEGLLRGGDEVGPDTLGRFFALHVAVLPAVAAILLGGHLWLVQRLGISTPPSARRRRRMSLPFFPDFLLRDAVVSLTLLAVLVTLALTWPADVGAAADPMRPAPEGVAPEWFYLFLFQVLKMLPQRVAGIEQDTLVMAGSLLVGLLLTLLPLWDSREQGGRRRKVIRAAAVALAVFAVGMTFYAAWATPAAAYAEPAVVPGRPDLAGWIGYAMFLIAAALAAAGLGLLAAHRGKMRRIGLLAVEWEGPDDAA